MNMKEINSKKLFKEYLIEVPYDEVDSLINVKINVIINKILICKIKFFNSFFPHDSAGAIAIKSKPGKSIGKTVELKYGAPTEILSLVIDSIIKG